MSLIAYDGQIELDDDDWLDDEDEFCDECGDCAFCDGDGWIDGYEDDPLWYEPGEMVRCASCGGSGRAKDQTIW